MHTSCLARAAHNDQFTLLQIAVEAEDVKEERLRVEAMTAGGAIDNSAAIVIKNLHKTFPASWFGSK